MAKKNISENNGFDTAQPSTFVKQEQMREAMQEYFDSNPDIEQFYVTSDGMPFYELSYAENHQKTLDKTKGVVIINR
jgi:ABC-type sugar transport system substrate-binding protein